MPKIYIKKRTKGYDEARFESALRDVKDGMHIRTAAKKHNIPYTTWRRWAVKPPVRKGSGRLPVFTRDEEYCIVVALKFFGDCGYPFDHQDVLDIANQYVSLNNKLCHLKLGCEWLRGFKILL